jgi:hypothetical protein
MTRQGERTCASGPRFMAGRTRAVLSRPLAPLLVGLFVATGCGSVSGQPTRASTATLAASTTTIPDQTAGVPSASIAGDGPSGIAGQAVAIVCGGPSSEQGCPHHPVLATIYVLRMPSRRRIATVRTDKQGRFRVDIAPGTYQLQARASSSLIWARVITTQVLVHQVKHATLTFAPRHPLPVAPGSASS